MQVLPDVLSFAMHDDVNKQGFALGKMLAQFNYILKVKVGLQLAAKK